MALTLESPAFEDGDEIPVKYTCEGEDIAPPLRWSGAPPETKSFALVCSDPDAPDGIFRHWAVFDLPLDAGQLEEGFDAASIGQAREAQNDFGKTGYGGPCPPRGHGHHRYHFKLYALDTDRLDLAGTPKIGEVIEAAEKARLDEATLTGRYVR